MSVRERETQRKVRKRAKHKRKQEKKVNISYQNQWDWNKIVQGTGKKQGSVAKPKKLMKEKRVDSNGNNTAEKRNIKEYIFTMGHETRILKQ